MMKSIMLSSVLELSHIFKKCLRKTDDLLEAVTHCKLLLNLSRNVEIQIRKHLFKS